LEAETEHTRWDWEPQPAPPDNEPTIQVDPSLFLPSAGAPAPYDPFESLSPPPDFGTDWDAELEIATRAKKRTPKLLLATGLTLAALAAYVAWPRGAPDAPTASPPGAPAPSNTSQPIAAPSAPVAPLVLAPAHEAEPQQAAPEPPTPLPEPEATAAPAERASEDKPQSAKPESARRGRASAARRERAAPASDRESSGKLLITPRASETSGDRRERASTLSREATDAMLRGEFSTAHQKLDQAIAADPRYAPAHRSKGLLLERMGRAAEAARAFRTYLRLSPNAADADRIQERLSALE
jgi:tetratricopeptide (TPR) repeat protein